MERFSHSSLETYRKCPAQFKFRYIDKIRKSDESIEAFMGKRIHEALEYLYNEVLDGRIPFFDHIIDGYNYKWNKKWHKNIGIVRTEKSSEYYKKLGENCIARYYRQYSPFEQNIVGNEIQLSFYLDQDKKYYIKSVIDRLDHDGEGNWEIHDYKSGNRVYSRRQADDDRQLALYQIGLLSKEMDVKSVKLIWHFLQKGIEIESIRSQKQLSNLSDSIKKQIDKILLKINRVNEFPAKKSVLCNWCYYWEECPLQTGTNPYIK